MIEELSDDMISNGPSADQCRRQELLGYRDGVAAYACWYPQMGGYSGKAIAFLDSGGENSCVDILVWHDGEFPFCGGESPAKLHHCDPDQFIEFGQFLNETLRRMNP